MEVSVHPSLPGRGRGRVESRPKIDSAPDVVRFSGVPSTPTPTLPLRGGGGERLHMELTLFLNERAHPVPDCVGHLFFGHQRQGLRGAVGG